MMFLIAEYISIAKPQYVSTITKHFVEVAWIWQFSGFAIRCMIVQIVIMLGLRGEDLIIKSLKSNIASGSLRASFVHMTIESIGFMIIFSHGNLHKKLLRSLFVEMIQYLNTSNHHVRVNAQVLLAIIIDKIKEKYVVYLTIRFLYISLQQKKCFTLIFFFCF